MTGEIIAIDETKTFPSGFKKREFVIEELDGKYPQQIKMEVIKDNCEILDRLRVGDEVTAHFNIRGNEYKGRYYVNLVCWRIESEVRREPKTKPLTHQERPAPGEQEPEEGDEIPF